MITSLWYRNIIDFLMLTGITLWSWVSALSLRENVISLATRHAPRDVHGRRDGACLGHLRWWRSHRPQWARNSSAGLVASDGQGPRGGSGPAIAGCPMADHDQCGAIVVTANKRKGVCRILPMAVSATSVTSRRRRFNCRLRRRYQAQCHFNRRGSGAAGAARYHVGFRPGDASVGPISITRRTAQAHGLFGRLRIVADIILTTYSGLGCCVDAGHAVRINTLGGLVVRQHSARQHAVFRSCRGGWQQRFWRWVVSCTPRSTAADQNTLALRQCL